jgi:membrane-bound ClpP family serine protease
MPSSDAAAKRGLRDSTAGRIALLLAVLVAAFVVSQSCGSRDTEVTKEEAAEIARGRIDYEPDQVMTRFIPRGARSQPAWAVSLSTDGPGGRLENITVVVVDAESGDILEVRKQG